MYLKHREWGLGGVELCLSPPPLKKKKRSEHSFFFFIFIFFIHQQCHLANRCCSVAHICKWCGFVCISRSRFFKMSWWDCVYGLTRGDEPRGLLSSLLGVGGSFRCSLLCTNVGWIPRGFSFFSALWFCTHWSCYLFICHLLTLQERTLKIWSLMQHNRLRDGNKKGWLWVWLAFKCPRGAFIPSELPHSSSLWASLKHICTGWRPLRGILVFFKP